MSSHHAKAQEFLVSLAEKQPQLPFEPSLLPELFARTAVDSNASIDSISALIQKSQGLTAQVLRLANSAYYGLPSGIASLPRAMALLGLNEIRHLVLVFGAASSLKGLVLPKAFPLRALWEHQVLTALLARELARMVAALPCPGPRPVPDELYAAGLLHDVGKILLAARCPEEWRAITDLAEQKDIPFFLAEDEYWGIDHSVAGSRLLSFWQLPARLTEPVSWHHAPRLAGEEHITEALLVAAANLLAVQLSERPEQGEMPEETADLLPDSLDKPAFFAVARTLAESGRSSGLAQALAG